MSVPPLERLPVTLEAECADPEVTGSYRCGTTRRIARFTPITGGM